MSIGHLLFQPLIVAGATVFLPAVAPTFTEQVFTCDTAAPFTSNSAGGLTQRSVGGFQVYNASGAVGDYVDCAFGLVPPGAFAIYWQYPPYSNRGIAQMQIGINGVYTNALGASRIDMYAVTNSSDLTVFNRVTYFSVTTPQPALVNFRMLCVDKNPSSLGYYVGFSALLQVEQLGGAPK